MEERNLAIDIAKMTDILKIRKKMHSHTMLVLGARAGTLFHSQILYDQISAVGSTKVEVSSEEEMVQRCIELLLQRSWSGRELRATLFRSLQDSFFQDKDAYIAALLKYQFFQLVLTTNIDVGLEEALLQIGQRKQRDFDIFIPGARSRLLRSFIHNKEAILPLPLLKVYGNITAEQDTLKERFGLPAQDSDLGPFLEKIQDWNMLMVGFDPLWDEAIVPLLFPRTSTIWYVGTSLPPANSALFAHLHKDNAQCFLSSEGESRRFFMLLYQHLIRTATLSDLMLGNPTGIPTSQTTVVKDSIPLPFSFSSPRPPLPQKRSQIDVLLLTVTEVELQALLKERPALPYCISGQTYYDLGIIGDAHVCLMQITSQPDNLEKSHNARYDDAIHSLSPTAIIAVGIARGFKYKGQAIGDILVSQHLLSGERLSGEKTILQKFLASIYKPISIPISTRLLSLFKYGNIVLTRKVTVKFGLIFSCTAPISDQMVFRSIHEKHPDVLGIEVATLPLHHAQQAFQFDCLSVKGIASWADDRSEQETTAEEIAAKNAAWFTLQVIALGGFDNLANKTSSE